MINMPASSAECKKTLYLLAVYFGTDDYNHCGFAGNGYSVCISGMELKQVAIMRLLCC